MIETLSRDHPRRTPPDGATASSCGWLLLLEGAGSGPLIAGSHGSETSREASGPHREGADRTYGASEPDGGDARPGGILGSLHVVGVAVRPAPRGGSAAPGYFRTRAEGQPATTRPA